MDWLETLDPEVIGSCPDLQQRLLFSRSKVGCAARTGTRALATPRPSSHPCSLQALHTDRPDLVAGHSAGRVGACGPRCSQRGLGGVMADRQERSAAVAVGTGPLSRGCRALQGGAATAASWEWLLCCSGRAHQASFLPRAKVSLARRCPLSGPTSWPSSRTSPIGPRCTSASGSCWARTGSTGEPATGQRPGPGGDAAPRLGHPTQHLPSSFLRALQLSPSPGCTTAPGRGLSVGIASWGTEHAGPVSLLHVTTRAGSQARSSPLSPGHAHGCHHAVPRGHQMTLCGWQVGGWAGSVWGRERSGRTADLGPSSGAPGSVVA